MELFSTMWYVSTNEKRQRWQKSKMCTTDFNFAKSTGIIEIIRKYMMTVLHRSKGKCSAYIGNVNNHM